MNTKQAQELAAENGKKDLLLACQIIPKALEDNSYDSLEVGVLAACEGLGLIKFSRIITKGVNINDELFKDEGE
jgi:hypothetical protein